MGMVRAIFQAGAIVTLGLFLLPGVVTAQNDADQSTVTIQMDVVAGNEISVSVSNQTSSANASQSQAEDQAMTAGDTEVEGSEEVEGAGQESASTEEGTEDVSEEDDEGGTSQTGEGEGQQDEVADAAESESVSTDSESGSAKQSESGKAKAKRAEQETVSTTVSLLARDAMLIEVISDNLLRYRQLVEGDGNVEHLPLQQVDRRSTINIEYVNN